MEQLFISPETQFIDDNQLAFADGRQPYYPYPRPRPPYYPYYHYPYSPYPHYHYPYHHYPHYPGYGHGGGYHHY